MGSATSDLYAGTAGGLAASNAKPAISQSSPKAAKPAMRGAAKDWARSKADELAKMSKGKRREFNTASVVYDEESGRYFYGRNKGIELSESSKNPKLFGKDGVLPKKSLNGFALGNCAEVDAINNALNAGAKLKNLTLMTVHAYESDFGKSKQACENCTHAFKGRIKHNHSGWKED